MYYQCHCDLCASVHSRSRHNNRRCWESSVGIYTAFVEANSAIVFTQFGERDPSLYYWQFEYLTNEIDEKQK